jgi:hypothetical protein
MFFIAKFIFFQTIILFRSGSHTPSVMDKKQETYKSLCIQKAHEDYLQRVEERGRASVAKCKSLTPAFLSMINVRVTADSLERHRGRLYLPIQPGCFPTFSQALREHGMQTSIASSFASETKSRDLVHAGDELSIWNHDHFHVALACNVHRID